MADNCSGRLYEILDISKSATPAEVKKAYHKKALQLHPDKTGGATTEEFKAIQEANAVLSDPEKRKLYDILGRAGMARLEQFGVDGAAAGMMAHPLAVKLVASFFFLVFFLCLLFVSLVVAKLDQDKSWSWAAVFTPAWILMSPLVATPIGFVAEAKRMRFREAFALLAGTSFFVTVVLFVRVLDGHMEWKGFFYGVFVTSALYYTSEALGLRLSYVKDMLVRQGNPEGHDLSYTSPVYIRQVLTTAFNFGCNMAFFILMYYRLTEAEPDLSFYVVFTPLYINISLPSLIGLSLLMLDSNTQLRHKLCMLILGILLLAATLYTYVMISIKMQREMNNNEGKGLSAAVCAIMLFVLFGTLVLLSCCGCCCVNVPPMGEGGYEGFSNVETPAADERGEANVAQSSPIVAGTERTDENTSKYNSLD